MKKSILAVLLSFVFCSALAQESKKETVTIDKDRDGYTVTHKDGTKHSYGKGVTKKK